MAEPSPKQTLILWALLAQGGAAAQARLGLKPDPKDRNALRQLGLIEVGKEGRGLRLEVTDKGWNWAGENLPAPLPANMAVLQGWLRQLHAFMQARGLALSEILVASPAPEPDSTPPKSRKAAKPKTPKRGAGEAPAKRRKAAPKPAPTPDYPELRERIRAAYLELAGGFSKDGVPLSQIRRRLDGIERGAVDDALRRMHEEDGGTTLMGLDNPREIEAEGDAALAFKGEQLHVLWVTR